MAAPKGVYKIESKTNNRIYIGSSNNINRRWGLHKNELIRNKHHSIILQNHVNKYGINDLIFSIIEECSSKSLIYREQYYIDKHKPYFNIRKIANSNIGIKRRDETKEKIKQFNLGKKLSEETKLKMAKRMKGNKYTLGIIPVNARKVINIVTKEIFDSSTIVANILGIKPRTLRARLDGQNTNNTIYRYEPST